MCQTRASKAFNTWTSTWDLPAFLEHHLFPCDRQRAFADGLAEVGEGAAQRCASARRCQAPARAAPRAYRGRGPDVPDGQVRQPRQCLVLPPAGDLGTVPLSTRGLPKRKTSSLGILPLPGRIIHQSTPVVCQSKKQGPYCRCVSVTIRLRLSAMMKPNMRSGFISKSTREREKLP